MRKRPPRTGTNRRDNRAAARHKGREQAASRSTEQGARGAARPGELFEAEVRDLTASGEGVVEHPSGRICFVPGVWPGERAQFRLRELRGRSGLAALHTLLQASAHRVTPPCPHHGHSTHDCGGCPWQFIAYEAQLAAKQTRVHKAMARLNLEAAVAPILPSAQTLGYRNRAQFKTDGSELGYVAAGSRTLVPVQDCIILTQHNRDTLQALRAHLPCQDWRPPRGQAWRVLRVDDEISADQVQPDVRRPFRQGNSAQNQHMQQWLRERLMQLPTDVRERPLLELFAGSGNFTEVIAAAGFGEIHAAEAMGEAVATLRARALPGVSVHAVDLYAPGALNALRTQLPDCASLLLDPPREGVREIAQLLTANHSLQHILYVSCDLPTFSRDLGVLCEHGFTLLALQPLDLFPHTPHVELLAHLQRR